MATFSKVDTAALNGAAIKLDTSASNGVAAKVDVASNARIAALLAQAGPLADNFAQTLLQPLRAPDPAAAKFAAEIADSIKHEMTFAIAQSEAELRVPAEGFGGIARKMLAAAAPEQSKAARARAVALVTAAPESQTPFFGRFAGKGMEAHGGEAVQVTPETVALFKESVSKAASARASAPAAVAGFDAAAFEAALQKGGADFVAAPGAALAPRGTRYKKLGFFITKVRAEDDRIRCGPILILGPIMLSM